MEETVAIPTREIMWNVSHPANAVVMYLLFFISLIVCLNGFFQRARTWFAAKPAGTFQPLAFIKYALLQRKVVKKKEPAIYHTLIYFGFLVLTFTTTMVFFHHDFGIKIYQGNFYLLLTIASDWFGLGLMCGIAYVYHIRKNIKDDRLNTTIGDTVALIILWVLCLQGFLLEGLRISATNDQWKYYSMVGLAFSKFFWGLSPEGTKLLHFTVWWWHAVSVFLFIAVIPYTKFLHIFSSSANLSFKKKGVALPYHGDLMEIIEKSEGDFSIGISGANDLNRFEKMNLDACTQCGRCQEVCPAYITGKPLSPKWLIMDLRDHLWKLESKATGNAFKRLDNFLREKLSLSISPSLRTDLPRAKNNQVQSLTRDLGSSIDAKIGGEVLDQNVFWACTSCRACVEACPVGIEHVDLIGEVRRNMTLIQGTIPQEAQNALKAIETRGNPFGPREDREKWGEGANVNFIKPGDKVEVLYWVGCLSAFDKRKQEIAKSVVRLLNKSEVNWGTLGNYEGCTGDPARRLGDENLFQSSAKENLEMLAQVEFKTIITNCPHCFNSFKNEYPQLSNQFEERGVEIVHHTQFFKRLVNEKKLKLNESANVTYHDPCYLGRYNDVYDEPRELIGGEIQEMESSREKGLCCGAGGGHYFMDLKIGERVNVKRVEQAEKTGAETIVTGCPFCMQMLEDGVKLRDGTQKVKDIAELLSEAN